MAKAYTIAQYVAECQSFPYSKEYFELCKLEYKLNLQNLYVESVKYQNSSECKILTEAGFTCPDNYFIPYNEAVYTEAEAGNPGVFDKIKGFFTSMIEKFIGFLQKLIGKTANAQVPQIDNINEVLNHTYTQAEVAEILALYGNNVDLFRNGTVSSNNYTVDQIKVDSNVSPEDAKAVRNIILSRIDQNATFTSISNDGNQEQQGEKPGVGGAIAAGAVGLVTGVALADMTVGALNKAQLQEWEMAKKELADLCTQLNIEESELSDADAVIEKFEDNYIAALTAQTAALDNFRVKDAAYQQAKAISDRLTANAKQANKDFRTFAQQQCPEFTKLLNELRGYSILSKKFKAYVDDVNAGRIQHGEGLAIYGIDEKSLANGKTAQECLNETFKKISVLRRKYGKLNVNDKAKDKGRELINQSANAVIQSKQARVATTAAKVDKDSAKTDANTADVNVKNVKNDMINADKNLQRATSLQSEIQQKYVKTAGILSKEGVSKATNVAGQAASSVLQNAAGAARDTQKKISMAVQSLSTNVGILAANIKLTNLFKKFFKTP